MSRGIFAASRLPSEPPGWDAFLYRELEAGGPRSVHAAWTVLAGRETDPERRAALLQLGFEWVRGHPDPRVREQVVVTLRRTEPAIPGLEDLYWEALGDEDLQVVRQVAWGLLRLNASGNAATRLPADAFRRPGHWVVLEPLFEHGRDLDPTPWLEAAACFPVDDLDPAVRAAVLRMLSWADESRERAREACRRGLSDPAPEVRFAALELASHQEDPALRAALLAALDPSGSSDEQAVVRPAAQRLAARDPVALAELLRRWHRGHPDWARVVDFRRVRPGRSVVNAALDEVGEEGVWFGVRILRDALRR